AASEVAGATTQFCSLQGGGAGTPGCAATQAAADLVANPDTPAAVRINAAEVLENNLLAISPDETTAIAFIAPIIATGQFDNLASRLAELRSGDQSGTLNFAGLTFINNGMPLSLGSLGALLGVDEDES